MKIRKKLKSVVFSMFIFSATCQTCLDTTFNNEIQAMLNNSSNGISLYKIESPITSVIGDNQISIVQFNPLLFEFDLISTSENNVLENARYWQKNLDLNIIFNAGMHKLKDNVIHRYYMRNYEHLNNPLLNQSINGVIAFNPKNNDLSPLMIFDLVYDDWSYVNSNYNSIIQGMRMLDCNGNPVYWDSSNQFCSMIILAMDKSNLCYIVFSRSPYSHNQMIDILKSLPFELINAVYLEGGDRCNFIVSTSEFKACQVGSFVSNYNENDNNQTLFPFPNYIGVKYKKTY
jgi:hypothetical protein